MALFWVKIIKTKNRRCLKTLRFFSMCTFNTTEVSIITCYYSEYVSAWSVNVSICLKILELNPVTGTHRALRSGQHNS